MPPRRAVVVGSGPNGLAAAVCLAQRGHSVRVVEASGVAGGGARSAELTLPGFVHDVCSAVHPLAAASPIFRTFRLSEHGLRWVEPPLPLAHPFDDGRAAVLERSVPATAKSLGADGAAYERIFGPFVRSAEPLMNEALAPLHVPRRPWLLGRFGWFALRSASGFVRAFFRQEPARALIAGIAAHSMLPLDERPSAAFALVLGIAGHTVGWPIPSGGAGRIPAALARVLVAHGGTIETSHRVDSVDEFERGTLVLLDVAPKEVLRIAGPRLSARYRRRLSRYRYGPGIFKVDWALEAPIPWRAEACHAAGTVHVGGTLAEMIESERQAANGVEPERPFVLVAQQSRFDPSRAPEGRHVGWAYCHVPNGSTVDMTSRIEAQIERFAPGFRTRILARRTANTAELERENANYVGGDIGAGVPDLRQLFTRPAPRWCPYTTPDRDLFVCSAATPPGPGVHGMCGAWAARAALRHK